MKSILDSRGFTVLFSLSGAAVPVSDVDGSLSKYHWISFRQGAIRTSKTIVSELCGLRSSKDRPKELRVIPKDLLVDGEVEIIERTPYKILMSVRSAIAPHSTCDCVFIGELKTPFINNNACSLGDSIGSGFILVLNRCFSKQPFDSQQCFRPRCMLGSLNPDSEGRLRCALLGVFLLRSFFTISAAGQVALRRQGPSDSNR